jgi:hypothetical protein
LPRLWIDNKASMKILSGVLILITAFLSFKHGWEGLTNKPETVNMLTELGIGEIGGKVMSVLTLAVGLLILFPQTFFAGNLLNAAVILLIMALALKTGNLKTALIEIPFLLMPLAMIWLGHPLKK